MNSTMLSRLLVILTWTVFGTVNAQLCISSSTVDFQFSLFLNVEAVPGATTQADIDLVEALFLSSYNTVSICDQDGAVFVITGVRIIVDPVDFVTTGRRRLDSFEDKKPTNEENPETKRRRLQLDVQSESPSAAPSMFESSVASSSSPSETPVFFSFQTSTWLVLVEGECNGCGTETSLFNDVSGRLLQHVEKHLKQSMEDRIRVKSSAVKGESLKSTTPPLAETTSDRILRVHKGNLNAQDNTCDCDPPFEIQFLDEFNEQLEIVESVASANDVIVLEQVECASEITAFQSTVVVLANVDLGNFYDELATLEEALLDGYNDINYLSSEACDDFFRIVTNVTIDVQETLNSNNIMLDSASGVQSVSLVVVYSGQCRGCGGTPLLSDDDSMMMMRRRRRLLGDNADGAVRLFPHLVSSERRLSDPDAFECFCPVGVDFSLPSTEDFVQSVNATLETVESVEASGIFETTSVSCSSDENDFQAEVTIGLVVTGELDQSELDAIEMSFEDTYNSLIVQYCDPFFRVVVNVTIVDVEVTSISTSTMRMLQLDNVNATNTTNTTMGNSTTGNSTMGNSTEAPSGGEEYFFAVFQVVVTGLCRGCGSGTTLFNDVSGRRNLFKNANGSFSPSVPKTLRMLQTNDTTCTCIINFVDNRAPSTAEFLEVFEVAVQEASTSIVVEEAVIVIEPTPSPPTPAPSDAETAAPSPSPSPLPSWSPSSAPSASPTMSPIPSSSPSYLPSSPAPSVPPSAAPTGPPTQSPSAATTFLPTSSPSATPSIASPTPSAQPSAAPSSTPTLEPSHPPSMAPSDAPSELPSITPTESPSDLPSLQPTFFTFDVCQGREIVGVPSQINVTLTTEHTFDPEIFDVCGSYFIDPWSGSENPVGVWYSFVVRTTTSYTIKAYGPTGDRAVLFYGDDGCPTDWGCVDVIFIDFPFGFGYVTDQRPGIIVYLVVFGNPGDSFFFDVYVT